MWSQRGKSADIHPRESRCENREPVDESRRRRKTRKLGLAFAPLNSSRSAPCEPLRRARIGVDVVTRRARSAAAPHRDPACEDLGGCRACRGPRRALFARRRFLEEVRFASIEIEASRRFRFPARIGPDSATTARRSAEDLVGDDDLVYCFSDTSCLSPV